MTAFILLIILWGLGAVAFNLYRFHKHTQNMRQWRQRARLYRQHRRHTERGEEVSTTLHRYCDLRNTKPKPFKPH